MDYYSLIDDFLSDNLSQEDRTLFIDQMNQDPDLKSAVDNHDIVSEALDLLVENDIRNQIKQIDAAEEEKTNPKAPGIITFLKIAAIMAGLALIGYLINRSEKPSPEVLYATYYSEYMGQELRGDSKDQNNLSSCELGHYYLHIERFEDALEVLQEGAAQNDSCTDKAQWYLMLLYLRQDKTVARDSLLNIITSDLQSAYLEKANDLSRELK